MAVDMFLKLDGIDGESKDSKHKNEETAVGVATDALAHIARRHRGDGRSAGGDAAGGPPFHLEGELLALAGIHEDDALVFHAHEFGFVAPLTRTLNAVITANAIDASAARLAVPSPDGRAHLRVARNLGISSERVADPLVVRIGALGTAAPFMAMIGAFEQARPGEQILMGGIGEGADAVALTMRLASRWSSRGQPVSIRMDSPAGVTMRVAAPPSTSTK